MANPLRADQGLMRTTLVTSLLRNLETNRAQRIEDVALFEIGRRYLADGREPRTLGALVTGHVREHWSGSRAWDFYDLKGLWESLAQPFALEGASWRVPEAPRAYLHPGVQAQWVRDGEVLGWVGRLHPKLEQERELGQVLLAELDLEALVGSGEREARYEPLARHPEVRRDFALVQPAGRAYAEIAEQIEALASEQDGFGEILRSVQVFDVYEGEHVEEGKRSVALQIVFGARDRTLTDDEVAQASQALVERLEARAGVELRS